MRLSRRRTWLSVLLCVSVFACSDEPLVLGELHCHDDCDAGAPSFGPGSLDMPQISYFDVVAARTVTPTWVFDLPKSTLGGVRSAPDAGVWVSSFDDPSPKLFRLDAEGRLVDTFALKTYGTLSVDDALKPQILSRGKGVLTATFDVQGELSASTSFADEVPKNGVTSAVTLGPDRGVRIAWFGKEGSSVASYDPSGKLLWKQTELRDARDFPFEDLGAGLTVPVSYQLVPLTDGALAVGVPKYIDTVPGLTVGRTQGVTLLESDGEVRWDLWFGGSPDFNVLITAGLEGSVIVGNAFLASANGTSVTVIDRDGKVIARWLAQRADYHSVLAHAIAQDSEGDVYLATLGGPRDTPLPTICRLPFRRPQAEVVCLAIGGVHQEGHSDSTVGYGLSIPWPFQLRDLFAPEPGSVVFSFQQAGTTDQDPNLRIVRVDF